MLKLSEPWPSPHATSSRLAAPCRRRFRRVLPPSGRPHPLGRVAAERIAGVREVRLRLVVLRHGHLLLHPVLAPEVGLDEVGRGDRRLAREREAVRGCDAVRICSG